MFSTYEHARGNTCSLHMSIQEEHMFSTYAHAGGIHVLYI